MAQSPDVGAYAITSGRLWSLVGMVLGLAGVIIGGLVVAAAEGGPGTGFGIVGGYLAVAVGLIAVALGGVTLGRSRRGELTR
ncbi:MAG: hypothetical protein GEV11_13495 [Streptosporangiales bacterium]|nr:hypothetical protein [Streptosporangiales bacterium]